MTVTLKLKLEDKRRPEKITISDTKHIILRDRGIKWIDLSPLEDCKDLVELELHQNAFETIDLTPLSSCTDLSYLSLSTNNLYEIDLAPLSSCESLNELVIHRNGLTEIDLSPLSSCKNLYKLGLGENALTSIDLSPLSSCTELRELWLRTNQLESIDLSPLASCTKLEALYLPENQLRAIDLSPLSNCPQLETLELASNNLTSIDLKPLQNAMKLQKLVLYSNEITSIDLSPLFHCTVLETLHLKHNCFQNVDPTPLALLENLECKSLSRLRGKREHDEEEITSLEKSIKELKQARRSAPPRLLLRDGRAILQIPFLSPNGEVSSKVLGEREYSTKAGVDRGLRVPVVISVQKEQEYTELLLKVEHLIRKRECLRKQAYRLQSVTDKKKNNWERKRKGLSYPGYILKKEKHINALWRKVRRLDREVARVIASKTVWFCEEHNVKTLFFEDLRSFQAHGGSKDLSYNLSSNLWGKIIDTVRYMRESLGHSKYSVWTVNPRYTSQTCHACGERGVRVEDESSVKERKGGEYFYCSECDEYFHADVNAARNIIHVHTGPSAVAGRTA